MSSNMSQMSSSTSSSSVKIVSDLTPPQSPPASPHLLTQFTTLIQTEKHHNTERGERDNPFEYDEILECDDEINRITNEHHQSIQIKSELIKSSPEPTGDHELAGLGEDEEEPGVEFEEFRFEDDTNSSCVSVSKKSSKSVVQQQSSMTNSVTHQSSVETKQEQQQVVVEEKMVQQQSTASQQSLENGTEEKKTKVERKTSKAGAKKNKSNAEISKENISVPNGKTDSLNETNNKPIVPEDLVKKLGPGESRVFAKVCVANLRRSFGDLTVINSATNDFHSSNRSNSLEYNNRVATVKFNPRIGPSSLPSNTNLTCSYGSVSMSAVKNNSLFEPSYWEGLFCNQSSLLKKSSFSKFDSLVAKTGGGSETKNEEQETQTSRPEPKKMYCASCSKQVFQMELIRAEKNEYHKNCFRCVVCRKVLSVDTYQSHEQKLYCKPHFKELFQPKAVENTEQPLETPKKSKLQLIICESQPKELPPDVVRASDTPSTGLEDIQIDVRSKFELFEGLKEKDKSPPVLAADGPVKRSASVLAKLKKYENSLGGQELNGVTDDDLNGVEGIELQSDEDQEDESNSVIKDEIKRKLKNPLQALNEIAHFKQMESVRSKWEEGTFTRDQMNAESRKEELQKFRSRLCQGKSGQLKELYEKGMDSSDGAPSESRKAEIDELKSERARAFREMFERGEIIRTDDDDEEGEDGKKSGVDLEVFEAGVARESKKIFEELDKKIVNEQQQSKPVRAVNKIKPSGSFVQSQAAVVTGSAEIVRSSDKSSEPIQVNTAELTNKFKFFETYEEQLARKKIEGKRDTFKRFTPPREDGVVKTDKDYEEGDTPDTYRDPTVVRHGEQEQDDTLHKSKTTSKMLSVFRQMEENLSKDSKDPIIRPLKQFTPPRDTVFKQHNSDEEEEEQEEEDEVEEEEEEDEENRVMGEDEFLKEVGSLARARSLRAKFERWEQQENERNKQQGVVQEELSESIESAKNLKAKFEAMRLMESTTTTTTSLVANKENNVPIRVNRFVLNNTHTSPDLSSTSTSPLQFSSLPADACNTRSSPILIMSAENKCDICEKTVYVMEKVEALGKVYHKSCFRCSTCKSILRMDNLTSNHGTLYCKTHFKQLFKVKGNYDEGFGHETQYQQWAKGKQAAAQQN